jgi:hypothetical protein
MISPSGVKMKREVTEKRLKTPDGNDLIKYDVKWKPVASQSGLLQNQGENTDVFYPQPTKTGEPDQSNLDRINKVILSRTPSPHRPNQKPTVKESTVESRTPGQPLPQPPTSTNPAKGFPIEDPRNPFHQEYLKLKALYDGRGIEPQGAHTARNIEVHAAKPKYAQPKIVVKRISNQSSKQESLQRRLSEKQGNFGKIQIKLQDGQKGNAEPSRTIKKIYNPAVTNEGSASRPATIIVEAPISDTSTPLKLNPANFNGQAKPVRTNLMNEYHYCDDCDVAFQPYNMAPEEDMSYYDDHPPTGQQVVRQVPYNHTTKTSIVQKSLKDGDKYSRAVMSQMSGKNVSPYSPPVYSPNRDDQSYPGQLPVVYQNENYNGMNIINKDPYPKKFSEQQEDGLIQRPQLMKSVQRPEFLGNGQSYPALRELNYSNHPHYAHHQ